jgi:hypothetical protein
MVEVDRGVERGREQLMGRLQLRPGRSNSLDRIPTASTPLGCMDRLGGFLLPVALHAPLAWQANKRYPRSKMLLAPTISALYSYPHRTQRNRAWVVRLAADTWLLRRSDLGFTPIHRATTTDTSLTKRGRLLASALSFPALKDKLL